MMAGVTEGTMITICEYDANWPVLFEEEAHRLHIAFGSTAQRIEHVGSTSVPSLAARPIIDFQVSVASLVPHGRYVEPMAALGYRHVALGDFDLVYPFFLKPAEWPSTHHVHLCEAGGSKNGSIWLLDDLTPSDRSNSYIGQSSPPR